jgi:hypothetical protein
MSIRPKKQLVATKLQQLEELLGDGPDLFTNSPGTAFTSEKQRRDFYEANKDDVIGMYASKRPGYRPRCWWKFSSPEPKKKLGQGSYYNDKKELTFYDVFEDDLEFLERLDLGLPDERSKVWHHLENVKNRNENLIKQAETRAKVG